MTCSSLRRRLQPPPSSGFASSAMGDRHAFLPPALPKTSPRLAPPPYPAMWGAYPPALGAYPLMPESEHAHDASSPAPMQGARTAKCARRRSHRRHVSSGNGLPIGSVAGGMMRSAASPPPPYSTKWPTMVRRERVAKALRYALSSVKSSETVAALSPRRWRLLRETRNAAPTGNPSGEGRPPPRRRSGRRVTCSGRWDGMLRWTRPPGSRSARHSPATAKWAL